MIKKIVSAAMAAIIISSMGMTVFAEEQAASEESFISETVTDSTLEPDLSSSPTASSSSSTTSSYYSSSSSSESSSSQADDSSGLNLSQQEYTLLKGLADTLLGDNSEYTDYYGDSRYDTDGNATLVNNQRIIYQSDEMQFISVTTKDGHIFYVLINYTDNDYMDNVYFLNKVDDYDLYALLYAGNEDEENTLTPAEAAAAAENANGRGKAETKATASSKADNNSEEAPESIDESKPEDKSSKSSNTRSNIILYGGLALMAALGAFYFLSNKKNGGNKAKQESFDDEDEDYEINEDDE